mgnify:CR=1 FL=1
MRVSTRARYSLRLMVDLAGGWGRHRPIALREIARRQGLSKRYLEQLATRLKHANLVTCTPGRRGGYSLPRHPSQIAVHEIVVASTGPINVVPCVRQPEVCPRAPRCPSRDLWVHINERITSLLMQMSLADLCEPDAGSPGGSGSVKSPCGVTAGASSQAP